MELEDQKQIEMFLENIIQTESALIRAKYKKIQQDEEAERHKNYLEHSIKCHYRDIARVKRQAILRQKGLEWSPADNSLCNEESEKEFQRWKNLGPGEKIKKHREEISKLENKEDWEVNDIQVDRWIEEENEKEIERLEKLTPGQRFSEEVENAKQLQEAEKNNWYCS